MDILAQYEKENPSPKESQTETYTEQSGDYGPIVSFVMRISRGKIQNEPQANFVLLIAAISIMIISVLILVFSGTPQGESREHLFPPGSSALSPQPIR